jgi:hypothetical protein
MFEQGGLSLDQAPPISVVFRFFFGGAIFGMLAGFLMLVFQDAIFLSYSTEALIFTHTLTLGVMLSFMFAALFQMLPVIAGVTLKSPIKRANLVQYPFVLGTFLLLFAFWLSSSLLFALASLFLASSILYIVLVMLVNLVKLKNHSSSSKGMLFALLSLVFVVFMALYLTATLAGVNSGEYYSSVKEAHYSFGLFGWVALLIISISFQVIEMFYVTPAYPKLLSKYLAFALVGLLLLLTIVKPFTTAFDTALTVGIVVMLSSYALVTLKRLTQRKRPLTDATVWFWRFGLSSLIVSMLLLLSQEFTNVQSIKALSYIFFASFALSIVFAMFYKIVPFLTWFHLNSQGYFTAPMMHEIIHPKVAMKHLYIHLATVLLLVLSVFISWFIFVAGVLTVVSFGLIAYHTIHAYLIYVKTQKSGEKFDMGNLNI